METNAKGLGVMAVHFCFQLNVVVDDIVVVVLLLAVTSSIGSSGYGRTFLSSFSPFYFDGGLRVMIFKRGSSLKQHSGLDVHPSPYSP